MLKDYDLPDSPPAQEPEGPTTGCCSDPTPAYDQNLRIAYCEACEAEWVPKAHLDHARELYVRVATSSDARVFDAEIARHARITALENDRRVYGEPDDVDVSAETEPDPNL